MPCSRCHGRAIDSRLLRAYPYRYKSLDTLLVAFADHAIAPAEQRANEIACDDALAKILSLDPIEDDL